MSTLSAALSQRVRRPEGSRVIDATWCSASCVVLVEQRPDGVLSVCRLVDGERGPALLTDDYTCGVGLAYDTETDRLVVALSGPPHVFDGSTGALIGVLPDHPRPTYSVEIAPGGRVVTQSIDGQRRIIDLRTFVCLAKHSRRTCRGWSAPVGLLPGDPALTVRSYVREGQWGTALVNAQTGRDLARVRRSFGGGPAFHNAAPRPNALEWVGVLAKGDAGGFEPAQLVHFTPSGAQTIDSAPAGQVGPEERSRPGIVRLRFLTADWLYTQGARLPHQAIHLPTGARRDCPLDGLASQTGQLIHHRAVAVLDLHTGALAPLYPGAAPEEGRSVRAFSPDGATALVCTPEALEWWHITR